MFVDFIIVEISIGNSRKREKESKIKKLFNNLRNGEKKIILLCKIYYIFKAHSTIYLLDFLIKPTVSI